MIDPGLLFHDPATGERITYEQLRVAMIGAEVVHAPAVRPATPGEAVVCLLKALVLGQPLTLFDLDSASAELAALDGTSERLDERVRVPGIVCPDVPAMLARARAGAGFSLTLFTAGSTGMPKRVTHGLAGLTRALKTGERHRASVWAQAYNPTHIAGVQVILQAFLNGNPLIHLFRADRAAVMQALTAHGVTHLSATPSFYRLLLPVETPFPGLRAVTLGGERCDGALLARLGELFPAARIRNTYASTEAGTLLVAEGEVFAVPDALAGFVRIAGNQLEVHRSLLGEFGEERRKAESGKLKGESGQPEARRQKLEARIQNPVASSLSPLASGQPRTEAGGENPEARSQKLEAGSQNPEASSLSPLASGHDWYATGDVVEIVSQSPLRFRIVGRDRDWVNVGGEKVNPAEVEDELRKLPGVIEARVFGRSSSVTGNILCAEIVLRRTEDGGRRTELKSEKPGARSQGSNASRLTPLASGLSTDEPGSLDERALRLALAERLRGAKIPRIIKFVDALALNRAGKMKR